MTSDDPGWELYRSFLAVARSGSLSAASRTLGLAQPTVGRHIDSLEAALSLVLFVRSQTGLRLTDAGTTLLPYAESLEATTAALLRAASSQGENVKGTVRISASEVVSVEVLPPVLTALRQRHPQLVVELTATNRVEDLLRRDADIAVRMLRPTQESLVARRVADAELGLHAHKDYLARAGTPRGWDQLAQHDLIGFDHETAFIRTVRNQMGSLQRRNFALRTDSDMAQLAAIRAGFGIGVCQVGIAQRDGNLVRVLPKLFAFRMETWVTMHADLRDSARCKAAFDALVDALAA